MSFSIVEQERFTAKYVTRNKCEMYPLMHVFRSNCLQQINTIHIEIKPCDPDSDATVMTLKGHK